MEVWINKKNGKPYFVSNWNIKDKTTGKEGADKLVLYEDEEGQSYVRIDLDFKDKFVKVNKVQGQFDTHNFLN